MIDGLLLLLVDANALTMCFAPPPPHSLDALLMGGLRESTITELAGETASGKTQVGTVSRVAGSGRETHRPA